MNPFFKFFGGKWANAYKYPAPQIGTIIEPFAGGAGYATRRGGGRRVVLYDADPTICGVWKYLIHATASEILALPEVRDDQTVDDITWPCEEAKWLVGFWLNAGVTTPAKKPSKWMRSRVRPGAFWGEAAKRRIAVQIHKINEWEVHNLSFHQVPAEYATWFVDPPYQNKGKLYKYSATAIDFNQLGQWCRELPGQVIVCENEGADWLPFSQLYDTATATSRRGGTRSAEVVWVNGIAENALFG